MTPNHTTPVLPPPDGLDRLLADFYRNEMPHPWPGPPAAIAEPAGPARERTDAGRRSRYTLAASVALLLGFGVYLSSATPGGPAPHAGGGPNPIKVEDAKANGKNLLDNANPMPRGDHPMTVPDMP